MTTPAGTLKEENERPRQFLGGTTYEWQTHLSRNTHRQVVEVVILPPIGGPAILEIAKTEAISPAICPRALPGISVVTAMAML